MTTNTKNAEEVLAKRVGFPSASKLDSQKLQTVKANLTEKRDVVIGLLEAKGNQIAVSQLMTVYRVFTTLMTDQYTKALESDDPVQGKKEAADLIKKLGSDYLQILNETLHGLNNTK